MEQYKKEALEVAGWVVSTVQEFLSLTDEEMEQIEDMVLEEIEEMSYSGVVNLYECVKRN